MKHQKQTQDEAQEDGSNERSNGSGNRSSSATTSRLTPSIVSHHSLAGFASSDILPAPAPAPAPGAPPAPGYSSQTSAKSTSKVFNKNIFFASQSKPKESPSCPWSSDEKVSSRSVPPFVTETLSSMKLRPLIPGKIPSAEESSAKVTVASVTALSQPHGFATIKPLNTRCFTGFKSKVSFNPISSNQSKPGQMRRAVSKDSIDSIGRKEKEKDAGKENIKTGHKVSKVGSNSATLQNMAHVEKEKASLQQQVSELVRNAETKKAEIASLRMEINRMKEVSVKMGDSSDESNSMLHFHHQNQMESLRKENRSLREKLEEFERSGPFAITVDTIRVQSSDKGSGTCLLPLSGGFIPTTVEASDPSATVCSEQVRQQQGVLLCEESLCSSSKGESPVGLTDVSSLTLGAVAGPSGLQSTRSLSDWDKASSSSVSEMSVACLQDRIIQMEETHYSTNEELQATLQELSDLQDQVQELQVENEQLETDKAVLYESLCSQTEKLEETRSQVTKLRELLFGQYRDDEGDVIDGSACRERLVKILNASEREMHLLELLKAAQMEQEDLMVKKEELVHEANQAKAKVTDIEKQLVLTEDEMKTVEANIESLNLTKKTAEANLLEVQELNSALKIEISRLKNQLESEQQKVAELQREREAQATTELDALLREARSEKEKVEEKSMQLQEQLALSQLESSKLKEQFNQVQEDAILNEKNSRKQAAESEAKLVALEEEKRILNKQYDYLETAVREAENKSQRHLEDKRDLKVTVADLQKQLCESKLHLTGVVAELEETKSRCTRQEEEWASFQEDLLTTVRVANDFKTEAQENCEQLVVKTKGLTDKITQLEAEIKTLKTQNQESVQKLAQNTTSIHPLDSSRRSSCPMSPITPNPSSPMRSVSVEPVSSSLLSSVERDLHFGRRSLAKWSEARGNANLSVKALIESIETATKQAKLSGVSTETGTVVSSRSSSTSSINSCPSMSSNLMSGEGVSLLKRTEGLGNKSPVANCSTNGGGQGQATFGRDADGNSSTTRSDLQDNKLGSTGTPSSPAKGSYSMIANKLEPRRNSYGDMTEKKDPLAALVKGGGSKRNALLKWCQNKTIGYKGIDITNFSSSWNDGLAFCALLHSYLPEQIPYNKLDSKDKHRNFTVAFKVAESMGVSTTLNPSDLISEERPDWTRIMAYVTSIYKHFET